MTQIIEPEMLQPMLFHYEVKVVADISGCDQIAEIVTADILQIITIIAIPEQFHIVFLPALFRQQKLFNMRNQRERPMTCKIFQLVILNPKQKNTPSP